MHRISDIATAMNARFEGNGELTVCAPASPDAAGPDHLAMAMDEKYVAALNESSAKAAVLAIGTDWGGLGLEAAIFVDRPRYAMAHVTGYFARLPVLTGIHETALVDPSASIGEGVAIGPYVTVAAGATIESGVLIYGHTSIGPKVHIGKNSRIGEGVRLLSDVTIGQNAIIHANAVIGSDGFSFVTPKPGAVDAFKDGKSIDVVEDQTFVRIHSLGSVVVGDDVEIGAGTTIDRGTLANTVIGNGTKLDNLVHIGHNVQVGETCLICGQVGIAGSAVVGDRVVLAGQVGVADHVTIGDNVIAAGKSGISSNVPPNRMMMGNPAMPMDVNIASYKAIRRLPRLLARIEELEKNVSNITSSS